MFQIGDTVQITSIASGMGNSWSKYLNYVGKIRGGFDNDWVVEGAGGYTWRNRELNLISNKITEKKSMGKEYKPGDIVHVDEEKCFPQGKTGESLGLRDNDLVVNISSPHWKKGEVVRIKELDGTCNPYFYTEDGKDYECAYLHLLAPLSAFTGVTPKPQKPTVTVSWTAYSDNVQVSDDKVKFDGKEWTREELQATVKRYQEVLRRPVASVPTPTKNTKKTKITKKSKK